MAKIERYCAPGVWDPPTYHQAVKVTGAQTVLFISGQVAYDKDGGVLHRGDFKAQAREAFRAIKPRMILMDVSMPEMNGLEATAAIRRLEAEQGGHVPIIGVTAHALKGDRERCLEAGMDDYLPKPISPRALLDKVDRWAWREHSDRRDTA